MKFKKLKGLMIVGLSLSLLFGGLTNVASAEQIAHYVAPPTSIKIIPTAGRITATWKRGRGATGSQILIMNDRYSVEKGQNMLGATTKVFTNLVPSTTYKFYLLDDNYYNDSKVIGPIYVTSAPVSPAAVKKVKVAKYSSKKAKVTWSRVSGVSGYEVFRSTSYRGKYTMVARTSNSSFVNSVAKGHYYYYKVRSFKATYYTRVYSNAWSNLTCIRF